LYRLDLRMPSRRPGPPGEGEGHEETEEMVSPPFATSGGRWQDLVADLDEEDSLFDDAHLLAVSKLSPDFSKDTAALSWEDTMAGAQDGFPIGRRGPSGPPEEGWWGEEDRLWPTESPVLPLADSIPGSRAATMDELFPDHKTEEREAAEAATQKFGMVMRQLERCEVPEDVLKVFEQVPEGFDWRNTLYAISTLLNLDIVSEERKRYHATDSDDRGRRRRRDRLEEALSGDDLKTDVRLAELWDTLERTMSQRERFSAEIASILSQSCVRWKLTDPEYFLEAVGDRIVDVDGATVSELTSIIDAWIRADMADSHFVLDLLEMLPTEFDQDDMHEMKHVARTLRQLSADLDLPSRPLVPPESYGEDEDGELEELIDAIAARVWQMGASMARCMARMRLVDLDWDSVMTVIEDLCEAGLGNKEHILQLFDFTLLRRDRLRSDMWRVVRIMDTVAQHHGIAYKPLVYEAIGTPPSPANTTDEIIGSTLLYSRLMHLAGERVPGGSSRLASQGPFAVYLRLIEELLEDRVPEISAGNVTLLLRAFHEHRVTLSYTMRQTLLARLAVEAANAPPQLLVEGLTHCLPHVIEDSGYEPETWRTFDAKVLRLAGSHLLLRIDEFTLGEVGDILGIYAASALPPTALRTRALESAAAMLSTATHIDMDAAKTSRTEDGTRAMDEPGVPLTDVLRFLRGVDRVDESMSGVVGGGEADRAALQTCAGKALSLLVDQRDVDSNGMVALLEGGLSPSDLLLIVQSLHQWGALAPHKDFALAKTALHATLPHFHQLPLSDARWLIASCIELEHALHWPQLPTLVAEMVLHSPPSGPSTSPEWIEISGRGLKMEHLHHWYVLVASLVSSGVMPTGGADQLREAILAATDVCPPPTQTRMAPDHKAMWKTIKDFLAGKKTTAAGAAPTVVAATTVGGTKRLRRIKKDDLLSYAASLGIQLRKSMRKDVMWEKLNKDHKVTEEDVSNFLTTEAA